MPQKQSEPEVQRPPQEQDRQPGIEAEMVPQPKAEDQKYRGNGKLSGKVALITGEESGISRAVAIAYAKEGADLAVEYLDEHQDAEKTKREVQEEGHTSQVHHPNGGEIVNR